MTIETRFLKSNTTTPSSNRLVSIDALRGLAALMVLIYHARISVWAGTSELWHEQGVTANPITLLGYATAPFSYGFLGVQLFFVLSGYCIHRSSARSLLYAKDYRVDWKHYIYRRLVRIYPTFFVALMITAGVDALVNYCHPSLIESTAHGWGDFLHTLLTLQGFTHPQFGSNGVFWTLAIEIHFYLVYPILFYVTRRFGANRMLLLSFAVSVLFTITAQATNLYAHFPFRSNEGPFFMPFWFTWTLGAYIAEIEAGRIKGPSPTAKTWITSIACLALGLGLFVARQRYFAELGFAVAAAALLYWTLQPPNTELFSTLVGRALSYVGKFSYSLYAIHVTILLIFAAFVFQGHKSTNILVIVPVIAASIAAAWLLFVSVERWSIDKSVAKSARLRSKLAQPSEVKSVDAPNRHYSATTQN